MREHLAMVDIEAVYCPAHQEPEGGSTRPSRRSGRDDIGGPLPVLPGSTWPRTSGGRRSRTGPHPAPTTTKEELKPDGEGWVVEVRGYTYWNPDRTRQDRPIHHETLLRNIIERSRPGCRSRRRTEEKKKLEAEPDQGKITHAFLYNVVAGQDPAAGTFR